jgi:two-component system, OmpR family, phosphate regulon response regulator PhoB
MPYRVIVAEASLAAVRAVELALPAPEFQVRSFGDGLDAIEAVREMTPDVVLSAFALPSRDGYELGSFVRSRTAGAPIALFFLRGAFEPFDLPRIAQVAYDGIIQKPFDGESLAALVREAIAQKRELPFLPEEPAIEHRPRPAPPPGSLPPASASSDRASQRPAEGNTELSPQVEARIREIVRDELRVRRTDIDKAAEEIVAAEVRRVLFEELKKIDTRKI